MFDEGGSRVRLVFLRKKSKLGNLLQCERLTYRAKITKNVGNAKGVSKWRNTFNPETRNPSTTQINQEECSKQHEPEIVSSC